MGSFWNAKWTWPRLEPKRVPVTRGPRPNGRFDLCLANVERTVLSLATATAGSFFFGVCMEAWWNGFVFVFTFFSSSVVFAGGLKVGA